MEPFPTKWTTNSPPQNLCLNEVGNQVVRDGELDALSEGATLGWDGSCDAMTCACAPSGAVVSYLLVAFGGWGGRWKRAETVQGLAERWAPGCVNAAEAVRNSRSRVHQTWARL